MKATIWRVFVALALLSAAVSPGGAITNGMPDGDDHPQAGVTAFRLAGEPRIRRLRNVAVSEYRALAPGYLILSQNEETGDGGTCSGDSGGPNFFGDADLVVAITVQGDPQCRATNVTYRLDTPGAQEFLGGFVTLP